ncbi:MAG: AAA family ATPase, partial [Actinomycetota bacterium]|nr:AAA family ATPase [Actinomycetota bacterium]
RGELEVLGHPEVEHEQLVHSLFEGMATRSSQLEEQCAALGGFSGGLLRGTLRRGRGLDAVSERFRGVVSGSGLRANKIDEFFQGLAEETNPLETWEAAVGELEALTQVGEDDQITSEAYPVLGRLGLRVAELKRVAARLDPDGWLSLALTPIKDNPKFEYQTKEDVFIDFASASAGQQATALLRVLLAQPGPPLIIDQPEDDLDSEVVQNIVEEIWCAKQHRQLVFSSHNANLVVNGDAELVVHCDYRVRGEQSLGEVASQGAIDGPAIREAITRVMEGGEKAFKLRKEKYGF